MPIAKQYLKPILLIIGLSPFFGLRAQLCSGSFGDPVFHETFGSGLGSGPALGNSVISYNYRASGCPNDGEYTIVSSLPQCFSSWYTLPEDHTPADVNGYLLLINASYSAGQFYSRQIKGLCAGTTYEMAAWVANVLGPSICQPIITPNLRFLVETTNGTKLAEFVTGDIPSYNQLTWNQYGLIFRTPAGIDEVILKIENNNPGGCGNDLAIDDITFKPCGPKLSIDIRNFPGGRARLCTDNNQTITLLGSISSGLANPVFQWQKSNDNGLTWQDLSGANEITLEVTHNQIGNYLYRMMAAEAGNQNNGFCSYGSNSATIEIVGPPPLVIGSNSPVIVGSDIQLQGNLSGSYTWKGPNQFNSSLEKPTLTATCLAAGMYQAQVADANGCVSNAETPVVVVRKDFLTASPAESKLCVDKSMTLVANGAIQYQWFHQQTREVLGGSANLLFTAPGTETESKLVVYGQDNNGCIDSVLVTIQTVIPPKLNAGPDKIIVEGSTIVLEGSTSYSVPIIWSPSGSLSATDILNPLAAPENTTTYTLSTLPSENGCDVVSDAVLISVLKIINPPNAFSPNGDGINDTWNIPALATSYPNCEMKIFDRYGKMVFASKGYANPWNGTWQGKPVPVGVYYYVLNFNDALPPKKASISVLR